MMELRTDRLIIRRFSENDGEDLYEYFSNPRVLEFEPYKPFTKDKSFMQKQKGMRVTKNSLLYV
ncbi:GNAT family N-acetyltransferase [Clostridium felsineum]|uniref:GNAT family N-acetyltransferase n=1 Tax=Clostridium felsineum TaxID=36839 RepID=UPI0009CF50CA|nr:GNAT family N-acetyltransferase [Clostridium felsineum]URZ03047.1 hypothetical protein CLAUR_030930 [Clostridium felsineum]